MQHYVQKLTDHINHWLTRDGPPPATPLCDFKRLRFEIRPGDVILVEGRSRLSEVIKLVTQSPWSHAALYIGRLLDIHNPELRARVEAELFSGRPDWSKLLNTPPVQLSSAEQALMQRSDASSICQ